MQQNKTNKLRFSAKINQVFLSPTLPNLNGRSILDNFFKLSSRQAEKYSVKQKVLSFQEDSQKRKMVIKSNLPLFLTAIFYPLKKL